MRVAKAFGEQLKPYVVIQKKPNESEQSFEVSYKQLRAKTDIEKCEIFKTLLQDTMKDHTYENLELNEHFEKVENETKNVSQIRKYWTKKLLHYKSRRLWRNFEQN